MKYLVTVSEHGQEMEHKTVGHGMEWKLNDFLSVTNMLQPDAEIHITPIRDYKPGLEREKENVTLTLFEMSELVSAILFELDILMERDGFIPDVFMRGRLMIAEHFNQLLEAKGYDHWSQDKFDYYRKLNKK